MDIKASDIVLLSVNELANIDLLAPSTQKRLNMPRFEQVFPDFYRHFVQRNLRQIVGSVVCLRFAGRDNVDEMEFLTETTDLIYQQMRNMGMCRELQTVAENLGTTEIPLYVALAIYAKNLATDEVRLIIEQEDDTIFLFRERL